MWAEPPARSHHGLSWDPVGGRTLLFGGVLDGEGAPCPAGSEAAVLYGSYCLFHDLWAWDGSSWEELTPPVRGDSPPARTEGATAVDGARGVLVLFGGQYSQWPHRPCDDGASPSTTALRWRGDTWEWDGDEWAEVVPEDDEGDGDPSPRDSATAVWDEVLGEVLLYGGTVDVGGAGDPCPDGRVAGQHGYCNLGDLWSWDGTRWLDRSGPAGGAEGRYGHVMAYDSLRGRTLVYGGDRYLAVGAGDPSAGPAALWAVDWRGAQAPATTWEGLTLRAAASGLGWELDLDPVDDPGDPDDDTDLVGEAVPGVALAAWDVRLGAWRELDRGEDDGAAPASLGWETDDGREARRLLLPSDRRLYLALRPLVGLGNGTGDAQVEVDWVELRVRYRWPAE